MLRHGNKILRSKASVASPSPLRFEASKTPFLSRSAKGRNYKSSLADAAKMEGNPLPTQRIKANEVNVEQLANNLGARLTKSEVKSLRNMLDSNKDGTVSMAELQKAGKTALEKQWTRELCLQVVEQPTTKSLQTASKLLAVLDYGGTALFAIVGCQLAGEKDMNLIGCTLIGCIAAMGGGSLNNLLYGSSAQLLDRPGVFWVRAPQYLMLTVGMSVLTFYAWPEYCRQAAKQKVEEAVGPTRQWNRDGSISVKAFVKACEKDPDLQTSFAATFRKPNATPEELFHKADVNKTGKLSSREMEAIVAKQFNFGNSTTMYVIDTLAMAAFAVVGANGAVQRGLHPLISATCGVTICFGGILRDVLCGRDLAIGGQSYAFAMGAGSGMYVLLRELRLRGLPFPLITRVILAFASTTSVRLWEYATGEPILRPMHYHHYDKESELLRHVGQKDPAHAWLTDVKSDEEVSLFWNWKRD